MYDIESVYQAKDVKDAVQALVRMPEAEIISGGTDMLIRLRAGKGAGHPLVSIHELRELKGVERLVDGDIRIGAGTVFSHITNDPVIREYLPMLGEAVDTVGGPQIRNMGTIGGNICNGATSADSAATMCTLEADIVLEGPEGDRTVPILEFYTGPGRTVRDRREVCKYFLIRKKSIEGWHGKYIKYGKRKAMEIATLGCAVRVKLSEDKSIIEDVRLAYGVAAPTPIRCHKAEAVLRGKFTDDADAVETFVQAALGEVNPRSSWRASKEFRLQLIAELARRALAESVRLAGGIPAIDVPVWEKPIAYFDSEAADAGAADTAEADAGAADTGAADAGTADTVEADRREPDTTGTGAEDTDMAAADAAGGDSDA